MNFKVFLDSIKKRVDKLENDQKTFNDMLALCEDVFSLMDKITKTMLPHISLIEQNLVKHELFDIPKMSKEDMDREVEYIKKLNDEVELKRKAITKWRNR